MVKPAVTEKGGETRRRLVEAAASLFLERGYSATSLNDLLDAAGLTKGGFYFHFASKAEVAVAVVRSRDQQLQAEVLAAASEYERASEQVAAMVRALVGTLGSHQKQGMGRIERLCAELRAEGVDDPAIVQPHGPWVETTAALFRRAQAEGDMDPEADPVAQARFAVASFVGLEELARTDPSSEGVLGVSADDYLRLVSRAVGLRIPVSLEGEE
jgi:AcrR family transcriptional regulator